jgi:hypothetical protein
MTKGTDFNAMRWAIAACLACWVLLLWWLS